MSFITGMSVSLSASVPFQLPVAVDASGNSPSFTLYSHMRVPGGTLYTFDVGLPQLVPASIDTILAIPPGARSVISLAASTAQFGKVT